MKHFPFYKQGHKMGTKMLILDTQYGPSKFTVILLLFKFLLFVNIAADHGQQEKPRESGPGPSAPATTAQRNQDGRPHGG
jgi:hypothetical protein